jgi:hypothetical protein
VILKDWSKRGTGEDPFDLQRAAIRARRPAEARSIVVPPPPIQGLGLAGGFEMQVQVTDGTFDYRELQQVTDRIVELGNAQPAPAYLMTPFRAAAPQLRAEIDRRQPRWILSLPRFEGHRQPATPRMPRRTRHEGHAGARSWSAPSPPADCGID